MKHFTSNFATLIEDMITYKESLGYTRVSYEPLLHDFDHFCQVCFPEETLLKREIVLKWMEKRPKESVQNLKNRGRIIRGLGQYLNFLGIKAYILPERFVGHAERFTPYIFPIQNSKHFLLLQTMLLPALLTR